MARPITADAMAPRLLVRAKATAMARTIIVQPIVFQSDLRKNPAQTPSAVSPLMTRYDPATLLCCKKL
jgi:hypothetical protein